MKLPFFSTNNFKQLNWMRLWLVIATVSVVWSGLAAILPVKYYAPVMTVLSAVQAGITFAMRSSKYVEERQEIPPSS